MYNFRSLPVSVCLFCFWNPLGNFSFRFYSVYSGLLDSDDDADNDNAATDGILIALPHTICVRQTVFVFINVNDT